MSYQVLARKWRPRNFAELAGQEHVLRALINALDNDRLHHAFLFTGTRGVGKTTIARILAKSLNCETGVSSRPCGECSACREIDEGRFIDLIEVDAASRTKVEDTRDLLENVQYAPTRGRYKVYLIDEVHMLSTHSFNALLKTLEEPPPHVKFLLATTDPQKLPVTILSRCLQFNLKRLPVDMIAEYLTRILGEEGIRSEAGALRLIARAADGSMRDALSLLDQAIAYGGGGLEEADVRSMLGTIEQDHVVALLRALVAGDAGALLQRSDQLAEHTPDFGGVLADMISLLQRIALAQVVPDAVDDSMGDADDVRELAAAMRAEDVQLYYQIALHGRRDLPLAPEPRGGFDMVLLRMLAFRPVADNDGQGVVPVAGTGRVAAPDPAPRTQRAARASSPDAAPESPVRAAPAADWPGIVAALNLRGAARELAANCVLHARDGDSVQLLLDPTHAHLASKNLEDRLQQALQDYFQAPVRLRVEAGGDALETPARIQSRNDAARQQAAEQAIDQDANVQTLREVFNARVHPDSVQPID